MKSSSSDDCYDSGILLLAVEPSLEEPQQFNAKVVLQHPECARIRGRHARAQLLVRAVELRRQCRQPGRPLPLLQH